jgi:hypothetical protein
MIPYTPTPRLFTNATPRAEWVRADDRCISQLGMQGTVLKVLDNGSPPTAKVRWDNGAVGRTTITLLRKLDR